MVPAGSAAKSGWAGIDRSIGLPMCETSTSPTVAVVSPRPFAASKTLSPGNGIAACQACIPSGLATKPAGGGIASRPAPGAKVWVGSSSAAGTNGVTG